MTAVFLSDVHLKDPQDKKTQTMIRFLREVATRFDEIYILGDFFDAWPMTSSFLIKRFAPVLQTLRDLASQGHKVYYFEGNHDFHLGRYFKKNLGLIVYTKSAERMWSGKRIYISHGDLENPQEIGYRLLRGVLRSLPIRITLRVIPGVVIYRMSQMASTASRNSQNYENALEATRRTYRSAVQRLFHRGYDVVIFGHTHVPEDFSLEIAGKTHRYLNTGDWVRNFTYITYEEDEFKTRTHAVI